MQKWEYTWLKHPHLDVNAAYEPINKLGSMGWELVHTVATGDDVLFVLRRPVVEPEVSRS